MKRFDRYYKIAEIILKMNSPFQLKKFGTGDEMFITDDKLAEFTLKLEQIKDINVYLQKNLKKVFSTEWADFFIDEDNTEYCFYIQEGYYIAVNIFKPGDNSAILYYLSEELLHRRHQNGCSPLNYIRLEKILIQKHAIILHSCHVKYQNKAILFTAPSGTGKSTQGDLWKKYLQAEIINGDRTILKENSVGYTAYGLPMSGTSCIFQNKSEKLGAIVVIRQGKDNLIERLNSFKAFQYIYSEITLNTWDQNYIEQAIELVTNITGQIPVYYFQCTKDSSAVFALQKQLEKDGVFKS